MTKEEISRHNETLAIQNIQIEYINGNILGAMKLCQEYMGLSATGAYEKVKELCEGGTRWRIG